jgi:general secretion pathway protein F
MPRYSYKAYDAKGALHSGEISAGTRGSALDVLSRRAQTPIHLVDVASAPDVKWWQREIGGGRLSASQLANFTRELSSLVKASLPVDETLRILAMQPLMPARMRRMIGELLKRVLEGEQLSAAISSQNAFPEYYSRLVAAGEVSGSLPSVLEQLAGYLERSAEGRARIVSSLIYPCLLIVAAAAVIGTVSLVLIPAVLPIFADAGVEPPFVVRMLGGLSAIAFEIWIVCAAVGTAGLLLALQSRRVRQAVDRSILRVPVLGDLILQRETGRFSRTLSMLLGNGVSMLDALQISGSTLSNAIYREAIADARDRVKEGASLSATLARSSILPPLLLRLLSVGEQTGQLAAMALRAAEIFEGSFQRRADQITAMATPVLTLLLGGVVGVIVVSVLSTVLSMNDLVLQ